MIDLSHKCKLVIEKFEELLDQLNEYQSLMGWTVFLLGEIIFLFFQIELGLRQLYLNNYIFKTCQCNLLNLTALYSIGKSFQGSELWVMVVSRSPCKQKIGKHI